MSRDVLARNWSWVACLLLASTPSLAENVDPLNDGSQHAWAENLGWLNAEPNGDNGDGIQAGDSELSGWMWSENVGWVSLSCKNTLTCSTPSGRPASTRTVPGHDRRATSARRTP